MTDKQENRPLGGVIGEMVAYYGSQRALAKAAGVKEPSVSDWVNGNTLPGLRSLLRIEKNSKRRFKAKEIRPELF